MAADDGKAQEPGDVHRSEVHYRALFDALTSGVVVYQPVDGGKDFVIRDINRAGERISRVRREEVVGRRVTAVFPAVGEMGLLALLEVVHRTGQTGQLPGARYRDGRLDLWVDNRVARLPSGELVAVYDDVSARIEFERAQRELQVQLQQSQKLEAIGRLAGGVAHDFNNLLTVIQAHAGFLLDELREGDPLREDALRVQEAGERAAALTRQLLALGRRQTLRPTVLDLGQVVDSVSDLLGRIIGEDITLEIVVAPDAGLIDADRGQVEQILLGLAVNAREAMPGGGKLKLEIAGRELDRDALQGNPELEPGPYVMLAVADTGEGMDEATRTRIFEPFFTTKPNGSGLGLATVHGIVSQSRGLIQVRSEPGQGTTFEIYLPRTGGPARSAVRAHDPDDGLGGQETVLLVEDEALVRRLAVRILQRHGYRVLEAANGAEALAIAGEHQGRIHLLLTDVVMPGINGKVLADRLGETRPETRVLFVSGYTDGTVVDRGALAPGVELLAKPFTPASLLGAVRAVLEGRSLS